MFYTVFHLGFVWRFPWDHTGVTSVSFGEEDQVECRSHHVTSRAKLSVCLVTVGWVSAMVPWRRWWLARLCSVKLLRLLPHFLSSLDGDHRVWPTVEEWGVMLFSLKAESICELLGILTRRRFVQFPPSLGYLDQCGLTNVYFML